MKLTDKQKRANIRASVKYWQEYLNLQQWQIFILFKNKLPKQMKNAFAHIVSDSEYKRAHLSVFLPNYTSRDDIDDYMIHEFMHICLSDYDHLLENFATGLPPSILTKVKESTAETLTQIIYKAHKRAT